jgi:hypothetical protein
MNMMRVFRKRLRRFKAKVLEKLDTLEQEALDNYNTSRGRPHTTTPLGKTKLPE